MKLLWNPLYKCGWYKQRNNWKKVVFKTTVDYDAILSLNEKHIEQQLDHKDLRAIT